MTAKTRRNKSIKKIGVALFILVSFGAFIVIGMYQNKPPEKKLASAYFEIFDPVPLDHEYREPTIAEGGGHNTSKRLIVYGIQFKLKAKSGDAHNVIVEGWGTADPVLFTTILKDKYENVEQMSSRPYGISIRRNEEGKFPFEVTITSAEAEGNITIYL